VQGALRAIQGYQQAFVATEPEVLNELSSKRISLPDEKPAALTVITNILSGP
jgi:hypothetical protein